MKTESEILFEEYCENNGIFCRGVGEGTERRPDYFIKISAMDIVVEVKQIDANKEDRDKEKEFNEKEMVVGNSVPGARVRSKIKKAAQQISNLTKGRCPGLLVLYNNLPHMIGNPLEPYHIRVGMYGFDTFVFTRPIDFDETPRLIEKKFGPKRQLTGNHNTSISAIAVLENNKGEIELKIYHNEYAAMPIAPRLISEIGAKQFVLSDRKNYDFQHWIEIDTKTTS